VSKLFAPARSTLFVAMRQLWERKLLNGIAVGGVTLGVLTLIALNAIMLGFKEKFTSAILKISPHVTLFDTELRPQAPLLQRYEKTFVAADVAHQSPNERQSQIKRPYEIVRALRQVTEVEAAAPSIAGTALMEFGGKTKSVDLRGIDVGAQDRVTPIHQYVKAGRLRDLDISSDTVAPDTPHTAGVSDAKPTGSPEVALADTVTGAEP